MTTAEDSFGAWDPVSHGDVPGERLQQDLPRSLFAGSPAIGYVGCSSCSSLTGSSTKKGSSGGLTGSSGSPV